MLLLTACAVLLSVVHGQFINSFAGPFDVELQRVETCPGALAGLNLLNFTQRLTRDRKYPKRFFYTGAIQHSFDLVPSLGATIKLSSWSSRGGWKENAYRHTFNRLCDIAKVQWTHVNAGFKRHIYAALGRDFVPSCPFPASRWEFTDFPVDTSSGEFKEFVYGKWRIDMQVFNGNTILSCHREYVDTVPKVQGRATPPDANFTGTIRIVKVKAVYP